MLEHVRVWMVTRKGELVWLGDTDVFGSIGVAKARLKEGVVVGFASEGYFDGAWRIDGKTLRDFDELYIRLAPFSVR